MTLLICVRKHNIDDIIVILKEKLNNYSGKVNKWIFAFNDTSLLSIQYLTEFKVSRESEPKVVRIFTYRVVKLGDERRVNVVQFTPIHLGAASCKMFQHFSTLFAAF